MLIPGAVLASKGGGGGLAVACYKGDELTSVELLDLYEGRTKGIKYLELTKNWENDIQNLAMKVAKDEENAKYFVDTLKRITSSYRFIPEDSELELTNDAFPAFLPRGCKAKQLANYYNDRLVWVDQTLFNKLSYRDQVALAFHETIYFLERTYRPESDSRYSRTIVAHIFNEKGTFEPPQSDNYEYYCAAYGASNKNTSFLAKKIKGSDKYNFEFSFIMLNGHYVYTQKVAHMNVNPLAIEKIQTEVERSEPYLISPGNILSRINNDESVIVSSSSNRLFFSWQGTDPGDSVKDVNVRCYEHSPYANIFPFWNYDMN